MTIVATTLNRLWTCVDRNSVGNLGFSHFSADAFVLSLLVGSAQQLNHLQPIRILGMIDVLIDGLMIDGLAWMVYLDSSRDLFRGPSFSDAIFHILPDKIILQALVRVRLRLSFTRSSMRPAGNITSSLRWRVPFELS